MIIRKNPKARPRSWLFKMTAGKCFYCGMPTYDHGSKDVRDWIFLRLGSKHCREHKIPTIRGGGDEKSNLVPACRRCNNRKGALTFDEFRVFQTFTTGDLNYRFAFDAPPLIARDWICCHSKVFEKSLIIHNVPSAIEGYRMGTGSGESRTSRMARQ